MPARQGTGRRRWDVIVIGCGAMGASASYNLARRGMRVLTIDTHGVNHEFGSSHGQTRIIRLAYYEDPRYVPMLRRAFEAWKEVESRSGRRLLQMTGGLMVGRPDGELVTGVLRSAKAHSLAHKVLSPSEAEERFGVFTLGDGFSAVYEETAGVLFAEDSVRAFVGLASEAGCEFRFSEKVNRWKNGPEGIEVETTSGTQAADRLVLCAGPWNNQLLGGALPLQCERQVPFLFPSGEEGMFGPAKMPVFIMEEDPGVFYYGVPDFGKGVKVARTHGGELVDPDNVKREVTDSDIKPVREFVRRRLRRLDPTPIESTTCLYTNTPDLNFAVGAVPNEPRVTLVSACSGHGFKFASVLGEVAADLAMDKKVAFDMSFLDVGRFGR